MKFNHLQTADFRIVASSILPYHLSAWYTLEKLSVPLVRFSSAQRNASAGSQADKKDEGSGQDRWESIEDRALNLLTAPLVLLLHCYSAGYTAGSLVVTSVNRFL